MAALESRLFPPWLTREVLRRVLLGGVAFAALVAAIVCFHTVERFLIESPRFALREPEIYGEPSPSITVRGVENASLARVMNVFSEDVGVSLYLLPKAERRSNLLAVDWVRDAAVSRIWPNRVEVTIEERRPAAYLELPRGRDGKHRAALIDRDGVILDTPARLDEDLPVLSGIREEQSVATRALRVRRALALAAEIGDMEPHITEINVADPSNLSVEASTGDGVVVLELGRDRYRDKLVSFYEHWEEIHRRLPEATSFDLRLDDRITALNGVGE